MADGLAKLRAQLRNYETLDPGAVEAVAGMEGLGGGIGDQGTSFGPFQLHQGGALPSSIPLSRAHGWAWSPTGIDYALQRIQNVAGGKKGRAAIEAIVRSFERPADPDKEIAGALRAYGLTPGGGPAPTDAGGVQANVQPEVDPMAQMALQNLAGNANNPLLSLALSVASQRASGPVPMGGVPAGGVPIGGTPGRTLQGRVSIRPGADRPGVGLQPGILDFARSVAGVYGAPVTIGTGTAHNQFVAGTNRESAHWTGRAADIPASGAALTRMGQAALIAAGMPAAEARRQKGGLFNIGGYQVIFNSNEGGNHFNHLHVGLRGGHG